jgi:hypothetical protein
MRHALCTPAAFSGALFAAQLLSGGRAMDRHGHHGRRPVGEPDAGSGERDLHDLLRELTRRMLHALVGGRDVARRRVVVCAEMRAGDSPVAGVHQSREERPSVRIQDDLRCLDHHLEGERMVTEAERALEVS